MSICMINGLAEGQALTRLPAALGAPSDDEATWLYAGELLHPIGRDAIADCRARWTGGPGYACSSDMRRSLASRSPMAACKRANTSGEAPNAPNCSWLIT